MKHQKKIAVILCGSGYKDGSEIRESVFTLLSLSERNAKIQCFAPDALQTDVVNCLTGEVMKNESRHMLVESARIARGEVLSLSQLKHAEFDGLILPGGFGAAKNLCNFAFKGSGGETRSDLAQVLKDFHDAHKPIGAICIAPAIVALAFKGLGFKLTVGESSETSLELEKCGHTHEVCLPSKCVLDRENKIVTTPAYMYDDAPMAEIFKGIDELVKEVLNF
ncbi:MAG: isoprenoid biosynthesis glyoxalase ElbB [Bacteriovorax sp.]